MCCPDHVNVPQRDSECFFVRHVQLNSRLDVVTIKVIPIDQPKIITGFSVIFSFVCWLRPFRVSLKFFSEIFTPHKLFPAWSGFSDSIISSKQFCCSICDWECKRVTSRKWQQHSIESAHHFSSKTDCNNTADVPSLILRTGRSAIPFVSGRWGVVAR